tara:strand:- start:33 stop:2807 length:2775 start_codon:yes stop_codon:yes gene_type:complete
MSSRKRKNRKKINHSPVSKAQRYVRGSFEPVYALSEARSSLTGNDLVTFGRWLGNVDHRVLSARLFFPKRLKSFEVAYLKKLDNDLLPLWYQGLFSGFSECIKKLLEVKSRIQEKVLTNNSKDAIFLLDEFENEFGISYWSISLKIALISVSKGLEGQKQYTQDILEGQGKNIPGFVIYNISIRAEDKVSPPRYYQMIDQLFEVNDLSGDLSSYLNYRLRDVIRIEFGEEALFSFVSSDPLFDQYEFFVKYLIDLTFQGKTSKGWIECCYEVFKVTGDERLLKVLSVNSGAPFLETIPLSETTVRDSVLAGNLENRTYELKDQEEAFELEFFFPQIDDVKIWPKGALSMMSLPTDEGEDYALTLFKYGMIFETLDVGQWLGGVASLYITPKESEKRKCNFNRFFWNKGLDSFGMYSDILNFNQYLFDFLIDKRPESLSIRWHKFWSDINESVTVFDGVYEQMSLQNRLLVDIESLIRNDRFDEALGLAKKAKAQRLSFDELALIKMIIDISLRSGDIRSALISVVDQYFDRPEMVRKLPFLKVHEKIDKMFRRRFSGIIELSIFYDIVTEIFGEDVSNLRAYAYEDYLISIGINKPSEWQPRQGQDRRKEVYFFRNVCVKEVMQFSIFFSSSKQLQEERIRICNLLIELDPESSEVYENELRALVRNSHIQSAVKQLQQSKISIEENEIRRWAQEAFVQDFSRLKELIKSGQNIAGYDFRESLLEAIKNKRIDKSIFEIPDNEAGQLLQDMVTQIIREAYLNQENGLDCYLSMRIRHGTLSGQLRNPVEEERLITKKTLDGDAYQINNYWKERLIGRLRDEQIDKIMTSLESFSRRFDDKVSYIAEELIQIRRIEKENGLFIPVINNVYILNLAQDIENGITFNEFVERCFSIFWYTVDNDLQSVRQFFSQDVKPDFHKIFLNP